MRTGDGLDILKIHNPIKPIKEENMKRSLLLFASLALLVYTSEAQFKQKVVTKPATRAVAAKAETTYTGVFTANLGFMAMVGVNVDELYQGAINVKRGFEDGSYLNIFITTPEDILATQVYGLAYGKMLSQPFESSWLFLNAGALFAKANDPSKTNYVGIPVGLEMKYDFTDFAALALRADVMPAYNFTQLGLAAIGQASLSISP